jgi:hypothetical protein
MNDKSFSETEFDEEFEDLEHIENWADGAVLWSTDWTAETVMSQLRRGNIDLEPTFQRRNAWTDKRQSLFIESLILGLPIPQLILAEDKSRKGSFIVIDGKQRLLAIRRFSATETDAEDPDGFKPLRLTGLNERKDINGKFYSDLVSDKALTGDLAAFENSSIRTVVIRNWQSESYLYEVFLRINTGSVQLSPQELRQALHPGPFSRFVDSASADSNELKDALGISKPDFRMRDAELLLRYVAYKNFNERYRGNLKQFLDTTTEELNILWGKKSAEIEQQIIEMENAFKFARKIFGDDHYLRKWNGQEYERRKNRAVFDIMLHFFSERQIRESLFGHEEEIEQRFRHLCDTNAEFLGSIEKTTKSTDANSVRFNTWGRALSEISGINIPELIFGG